MERDEFVFSKKEFVVPTSTSTIISKLEERELSEFYAVFQCLETSVGKQQNTIANLRKEKQGLQRKVRSSQMKKKKTNKNYSDG